MDFLESFNSDNIELATELIKGIKRLEDRYIKEGDDKRLWFFTFGIGTPMKDYVQPVLASDYCEARNKMLEENGKDWAFQYDRDEFIKNIPDHFYNLKLLRTLNK